MDAVVIGALEEICLEGIKGLFYSQRIEGLTLHDLWPKIHSYLSSNHLPLCKNVKKVLWSNLLSIPSLHFECNDGDPKIQSFEDSERMELKILPAEHLLKSFVGVYDHEDVPQQYRRVLNRIAIARTDGVTQNDLAKELGIENKSIFYTVKKLESRGLIVRQSTLIRNKEFGHEGEYKNGSTVNTNMLYLYRYAKHLGSLQRLEITKEDKAFIDGDPEEGVKEDVHIKDYEPALKAICDKLEKANDKVLVVSDIKKELGYCKTSGHRAWRNILHKLKDAGLVEEFYATVHNKKVICLRLLNKFSPKSYAPSISCGGGHNDLATEQQVKPAKRGQITEQLMELPIERQIYDMIDAEGSKGLTLNEQACKRLGINSKEYDKRNRAMVSKYGMHLESERLNRGQVNRAWTSRNLKIEVSNTLRGKLEDTVDKKYSNHAKVGQLQLAHTNLDSDHLTSKVDGKGEKFDPVKSLAIGRSDTPLDSRSLYIRQCDGNGISSDAELQMANVKPAEKVVSLETSSSAKPAPQSRRLYIGYPRLGLNSSNLQREQRIIEILQEKKVLIKSELPRLLESLENLEKKHTMMDKKTLDRSLNKLQNEGKCKCISVSVPSVTNCLRTCTIVVVLHPSVYNAEDLLDRAQERLRSFQRQIRTQVFSRHRSGISVPVLNDVERIGMTKDQSAIREANRNNGFILGKMVRAKLLHVFLWGYITRLPGWDNAISGRHGYEPKNPRSACKLFELDAAYKAMPLELFLQVVGFSPKSECIIENCRNDLCLSELPIQKYRCLMDTRATAHLSALIDILKRLKLIRLIDGELLGVRMGPHVILRHSLELKPYIEEPARMVLPSTNVDSFDLRFHFRHDFVLESRKVVDEYWNTLEYCYAASDRKAALHAFPGSAVKEVFFSRSWESVRVMTADQQAKLFKLVANEDTDKKISYKKCKEIAENLNLTLEQVLRYDMRQKHKSKGAESANEQASRPLIQAPPSYKRKRPLKGKPVNNGMENVDEELGKLKHAKTFIADDVTEERTSALEDNEMHILIDELDSQKEAVDDLEQNAGENGHSHSTIHNYARQKRFSWTENKDRQLVIEYVRNRAALGAKFHGTDWASLQSLPASPHTCKRRMSTLNSNKKFRKAVKTFCNMLSSRYAKHLENSNNKPLDDHTNDSNFEERWDDFDNEDIKMVLDGVLRYKQTAKSEADKGYGMLMNGGNGFRTQTYITLAVSNAIELLKIVCLSPKARNLLPKTAQDLLAETTRLYSEHDMHTAVNYLRERNFMVKGGRISDVFTCNRSSSPFPLNTGERADEIGKWLDERENDLLDKGVDLYADVHCGDVLQLCLLMCVGEVSMFPCLPDEGVGEIGDSKKRNRDDNDFDKVKKPKLLDSEIFSRKEKGFPGIKVSLSRSMISRVDAVASFPAPPAPAPGPDPGSGSGSNLEHKSSSVMTLNGKSIWEDMACYAKHLTSLEVSPFLFQTVYSAILKARDQGLSMEEISNMIDDVQQGEKIEELIVEVLEAFGCALKVNGYDSIYVVDSKYQSKYFLLATSHQHLDRMDRACYKPILPWVDVDGTINENVYKGLVRRLLGVVMQNPGIMEEHIIGQMDVLNPQESSVLVSVLNQGKKESMRHVEHSHLSLVHNRS
ncbi:uncharacterized protein LOC112511735 isoform X3 [Cynara cardunculus var. scolymus]|uniref:uncharacterized protein LOC112511735 isoform X3 n=1 Tax=Cynara cardunculus var. scolymus TaxID=59895 RepID=UPI000D62951B|nr:uncharacterized protein LOC112511735 isoform X3 [Cynara cardunculus var. scolymus]